VLLAENGPNIVFVEGLPGSGKTSTVLVRILKRLRALGYKVAAVTTRGLVARVSDISTIAACFDMEGWHSGAGPRISAASKVREYDIVIYEEAQEVGRRQMQVGGGAGGVGGGGGRGVALASAGESTTAEGEGPASRCLG
jgi:hypothetical protein